MAIPVAEILAKVRRLQIVAARQVDDLLAGAYRSVFRGRGMEFDEVREYAPGDDVRSIDWNVTARTGRPHVKRFTEERELTVIFAVDVSGSGAFGTAAGSKLDLQAEVCALLMLSAQRNNDKIGLLLFARDVKAYYPARKGRAAARRLLRELVAVEPVREPTDLAAALGYLSRVVRRRAVVFLFSDFLDAGDFDHALRLAAVRHDLVAIPVQDRHEIALPPVGFIRLSDPETGEVLEVDTAHRAVRELFRERARGVRGRLSDGLRRAGVDELAIRTDQDYTVALHRFFRAREKRRA
jgi:uncharacterized protein (DUF58 family)